MLKLAMKQKANRKPLHPIFVIMNFTPKKTIFYFLFLKVFIFIVNSY